MGGIGITMMIGIRGGIGIMRGIGIMNGTEAVGGITGIMRDGWGWVRGGAVIWR